MTGKRIGYIRVSTIDQNPDRQLEGIELDKKFIEYASAATTARPKLQEMLDYIREDDMLFVHSMDRLARNLFDLKKTVNQLLKMGVTIKFIKEGLTFTPEENNSLSNLMLSMMGAFAEFELAFIKERQAEGIAEAKKRGVYRGRKTALNEKMMYDIKNAMLTRKPKTKIAETLGISRESLYKYLKKLEKNETR